jgi:ATP-dependent Zn protease
MGETVYDEKTAYHEAGHAVIDCVVGLTVRSVTIVPNGKVAGKTCVAEEGIPPEWDTYSDRSAGKKKYIRRYTLAKLAGYAAVQKRFPDHEREEADRRDEVSAQIGRAHV